MELGSTVIDLTDSPPILDRKRKRSEVNSVTKVTTQLFIVSEDDFLINCLFAVLC